ncbi:hypothetical protein QF117_10410 [Vibrio sp. YMD68]|uniref:hypothetical protein n=1 Tax=Vibrio sp. YMD68 TaxID=3042300 RepID=UPI00249AEA62|nr:hypothetical protein [Vibrio sp. YMD68]WGW01205.1 hypothetical protein QF117_10410 [Vibrio sp. YMD68]
MKRQTIYQHDPNAKQLSAQCCFEPSSELKGLLRYLHQDDDVEEALWKARYNCELNQLRQPVGTHFLEDSERRPTDIVSWLSQKSLNKSLELCAVSLLLPIFKRVKVKEHTQLKAVQAWEKANKAFEDEKGLAEDEGRAVALPDPPKKPSSPKQHRLPKLIPFKKFYFKRFFSEGATALSGPHRYCNDLYTQAQLGFLSMNITYLPQVKAPFSTTALETMYFQAKKQKLTRTQCDKFDTLLRYFILHIDRNTYVCTKTQRQMAQETHITESTVSRFIDTLVAANKVIRHKVPNTSTKLLIAADELFDGQEDVPRPISKNYSFIEACILQSKFLEKLYYQAICHSKLPHIRQLAITEYTIFKRS